MARELLADPEPFHSHLEIGRFDISYAVAGDDGVAYFIEDGGLGLTVSSGWANSPNGVSAGFDDFTATHVGGPSYEFVSVWRT